MNAGNKNIPSTHHPRRRNVTTLMVGLKKTVTYAKISPKSGEPQRYSWGTQKKKKKKKNHANQKHRCQLAAIPDDDSGVGGDGLLLPVGDEGLQLSAQLGVGHGAAGPAAVVVQLQGRAPCLALRCGLESQSFTIIISTGVIVSSLSSSLSVCVRFVDGNRHNDLQSLKLFKAILVFILVIITIIVVIRALLSSNHRHHCDHQRSSVPPGSWWPESCW